MNAPPYPREDALIAARFDTVIYDLDGTLIDSAKDMQVAVSNVLADHGLPEVTEDDVRIFMGQGSKVTMGKAFAKFGKPLDEATLSAVTKEFVRYYEADPISHTVAFEGVADVVAHFARLGLKQGVCTNKFETPSRTILEHLKLMPPIADVAGADTFPVRKPDPKHILMLLERMGGDPKRAVMIGDSIHDVEAAHAAGLPAVLVSWGYTVKPASELGAEAVIQTFGALPEALGAIATR
jgi:phosphoglycolate phosphatase